MNLVGSDVECDLYIDDESI